MIRGAGRSVVRPRDLHNSAVVHMRDAVRVMEHTRVMGHDNYRPTRLHGMRSQQLHDGLTASMVKSGGGLVAHDDARLMNQRAGNRDALLLSTGQRRRQKID